MKRIVLFLATNLAVIVLLGIILRLIGFEGILDAQGVDLNLGALLVFAAVVGFGGRFISLAISKWTAKRMMGVQVIEQPRNDAESWLVKTVRQQAQAAGIGMPEVGHLRLAGAQRLRHRRAPRPALVAVSTGLLRGMRRRRSRRCSATRSATSPTATWSR